MVLGRLIKLQLTYKVYKYKLCIVFIIIPVLLILGWTYSAFQRLMQQPPLNHKSAIPLIQSQVDALFTCGLAMTAPLSNGCTVSFNGCTVSFMGYTYRVMITIFVLLQVSAKGQGSR